MSNYDYRPAIMPPVVKNILIINVILFFATIAFQFREDLNIDLMRMLALHYPGSEYFYPHQLVTHMFMHGNEAHIFFNMLAVWMFGRNLENLWGSKRFLIFYLITGLGAAVCYLIYTHFKLASLYNDAIENPMAALMFQQVFDMPMVGASGALFGVLMAFGMLFPNTLLFLLFFPIPIKAKYFVILYGLMELFSGIADVPGDNVAHFAHLGGMLFGFILIKIFNRDRRKFY